MVLWAAENHGAKNKNGRGCHRLGAVSCRSWTPPFQSSSNKSWFNRPLKLVPGGATAHSSWCLAVQPPTQVGVWRCNRPLKSVSGGATAHSSWCPAVQPPTQVGVQRCNRHLGDHGQQLREVDKIISQDNPSGETAIAWLILHVANMVLHQEACTQGCCLDTPCGETAHVNNSCM